MAVVGETSGWAHWPAARSGAAVVLGSVRLSPHRDCPTERGIDVDEHLDGCRVARAGVNGSDEVLDLVRGGEDETKRSNAWYTAENRSRLEMLSTALTAIAIGCEVEVKEEKLEQYRR